MSASSFEIKLTTPVSDIMSAFTQSEETIKRMLIQVYRYVGEACVKEARENGNYKDQTGNLRSSIGYAVLMDGAVVEQHNPEQGPRGTDKSTGTQTGASYLRQLIADESFSKGIVLIVSAGMNYAAYVEARYNYVVLSSAEQKAPSMVKEILNKVMT